MRKKGEFETRSGKCRQRRNEDIVWCGAGNGACKRCNNKSTTATQHTYLRIMQCETDHKSCGYVAWGGDSN